jgi:glycosyltransferase involved in cell wall biosynthesis
MLKIAYLFQNINTRFDISRAEQLHTHFTIQGLQERGHQAFLMALQGREVIFSGDIDAIRRGCLKNGHFGKLGMSGSSKFKKMESAVRRMQTELKLPYYALFESFRIYDAGYHNLRGWHLLHERYNTPAVGGAIISRKLGIPYILEVNADLVEQRAHKGKPERGLRWLLCLLSSRFAFDTAAKIICTSEVLESHLINKWGIDRNKTVVLPCAADVEVFGQRFHPELTKQCYGLNSEQVVMWVGGFHVWQDLDLLAKSFSHVVQILPNTKLVMVGDGDTRRTFEQKINLYGIQDYVVMLGTQPFEKIPELLAFADVVVSPSPAHLAGQVGAPMKIFEYMAAGKAIVATNQAQFSAIIRDGHNGLLVTPGDVDAFTNAILTLLGDQFLREQLGKNARKQALERHSWDGYSRQLEEIYFQIL